MSKHTPGPWFYGFGYAVRQAEKAAEKAGKRWGNIIARVHVNPPCPPPDEIEMNGFLIAAAPDLLEACRIMLSGLEAGTLHEEGAIDILRNVITKATEGRAS